MTTIIIITQIFTCFLHARTHTGHSHIQSSLIGTTAVFSEAIYTAIYTEEESGPQMLSNYLPEVKLKVSVTQPCPILCDPLDSKPPGSSLHGILQARILEGVAMSFFRRSFPLREQIRVSCIAGIFYTI